MGERRPPVRYPPLNYQDWYDFVFATVSRYRDDIHLWGIWNEPNLDQYLQGADPRVYRSLVITARAAIRAANPTRHVLGPEVSFHGVKDGWFAAVMHDFGDLFDIVTVHWYADGPKLDVMMDQLVRPLSLGKPVWMSEVGMKPCASLFGEAGQALLYQRVLSAFQARRSWWTGVLFYDLYEPPVGPRLRHRDHPRRLVEPPGVPAVAVVHPSASVGGAAATVYLTASIRSSMLTFQSTFADSIVT